MQLNHKLKMERLNRRLSRESLANSLNELLKKDYYTERKIGIIENNEESLKFEVVDEMCFFFNLTIRDLIEKKWPLYNQYDINEIQEKVTSQCHIHDDIRTHTYSFSQLINHYNLVNKNDWIPFPKYDFIQRIYHDYFKRDIIGYPTCEIIVNTFNLHYPDYLYGERTSEYKDYFNIFLNVKDDSAGMLSITDERDPINNYDLEKEIEIIEHAIALFLESRDYEYPYEELDLECSLEKFPHLFKENKVDLNKLTSETFISKSTLEQIGKSNSNIYFSDIKLLCNHLNLHINNFSNYTSEIQDNIDLKSMGEHISNLTDCSDIESFNNTYYLSSQETMFILPKYCYEGFINQIKDALKKKTDVNDIHIALKQFIFQWYKFNKANCFLAKKLNGKIGKDTFYMFTRDEIEAQLDNKLYPKDPVALLGKLTLHRIAANDYRGTKGIEEIIQTYF